MNPRHFGILYLVAALPSLTQVNPKRTRHDAKPLSVCTVLGDLGRYNGKMISVRGIIRGTSEGSWLIGDGCKRKLVTKGYTWPNAIAIVAPGSSGTLHQVEFETDERANEMVMDTIRRMKPDPTRDKVILTFIGLFETQDRLEDYVITDSLGSLRGSGFGHLGEAPAQLQLKTVLNPKIEHWKPAISSQR